MIIVYSQTFAKEYHSLTKRNSLLAKAVRKKVKYFISNPHHPSLKIHRIYSNKLEAFSFSITGNLRILFNWLPKNKVIFYNIGPHSHVYKRK